MDVQNDTRNLVLRLFLKHQVMLSGYLYTVVEDWELVEEALQETAVFICSRWADFTPGTNFGTWARTVARMRCREVLQRRRRNSGLSLDLIGDSLADPITSDEWERYGQFSPKHKEALTQCVKALPAYQRRLVEMRYLERKPCDCIAARLAKSVEAVYMTLTRVRRRLKQCVEQRLAQEAS